MSVYVSVCECVCECVYVGVWERPSIVNVLTTFSQASGHTQLESCDLALSQIYFGIFLTAFSLSDDIYLSAEL